MAKKSYHRSVFINCPIDNEYRPLFRAAVFIVIRCDFFVRCAVEESDSSDIRLNKIFRMISECRYGIHDLSRTQLDRRTRLPRFNMPFELGIFLAAKYFGSVPHEERNNLAAKHLEGDPQDKKNCLIFEKKPHSYEKYISDIKGQDIASHQRNPKIMIGKIRDWLVTNSKKRSLPGATALWKEYQQFVRWLPGKCRANKLKNDELIYNDYAQLVYEWIEISSAG